MMRFSIVTPSFRNSEWLKLCVASTADQDVPFEHIIQDAGSDDGTLDWLLKDDRVKAFVEKDKGMYDAINRGFRRSEGDILAWLNCDEQYLPGALKTVGEYFEKHPEVDVVFGDAVVIDAEGNYLCHRKMQIPLKYHTMAVHLSTLSCTMFFRRRVVFEHGLWFDTRWRSAGDAEWMLRLLQRRFEMRTLRRFTSVFTLTGANLSASATGEREGRDLARQAPGWVRTARPLIIVHHRLRRLLGGVYSQTPFSFEAFTPASPERRIRQEVSRPNFRLKPL